MIYHKKLKFYHEKNLLILLALNYLSLNLLLGQQSNTYRNQVNNIFTNVNPSPITTGLLADYGMEFIDTEKFNGTLVDANKVDLGAFRSLYISMYSMRYNNNFTLPSPRQLNNIK